MNCIKEKRAYSFNVTEMKDGKETPVMNFDFGGHHDLAALAQRAKKDWDMSDKHAEELVLGMRLLHHVLKKYPENDAFASFLTQVNDFKQILKKGAQCEC